MQSVNKAITSLYAEPEKVSFKDLFTTGAALLNHAVGFLANSRFLNIAGSPVPTDVLQNITNETTEFVTKKIDSALETTSPRK